MKTVIMQIVEKMGLFPLLNIDSPKVFNQILNIAVGAADFATPVQAAALSIFTVWSEYEPPLKAGASFQHVDGQLTLLTLVPQIVTDNLPELSPDDKFKINAWRTARIKYMQLTGTSEIDSLETFF
jgi:hypothetical protein